MLNAESNTYKYRLMLNCVVLVTLASVMFVYPFNHHFRFTLGVVVLSALLLHFPNISILGTAVLSGIGILTTRVAIDFFIQSSDLLTALVQALPAFSYYMFFGVGLSLFGIRASVRDVPVLLAKLGIVDLLSNFIEFSIRNDLSLTDSTFILPTLTGVALLRSILAIYCFYCLRHYGDFILAEERSARYVQMTIVFSQLKAELYYLKKSSQDIERVMERSYMLYKQFDGSSKDSSQDSTVGSQALTIARDIHEIKKDYQRVVGGIENILPSVSEEGMALSEVFYIMEQNTARLIHSSGKKIKMLFSHEDELTMARHYRLVSILNNLIINAIEASTEYGLVTVRQSRSGDNVVFTVEDNGSGIDAADLELIFQPGYSTKYSETTGKMSTGLGLAHVKNLVESMDGEIHIDSRLKGGTKFSIIIPYFRLAEKDVD